MADAVFDNPPRYPGQGVQCSGPAGPVSCDVALQEVVSTRAPR
jgi:hypothetical protein